MAADGDGELPSWSQLALGMLPSWSQLAEGMLAWSQGSVLLWAQVGTPAWYPRPSLCPPTGPALVIHAAAGGSHQLPRKWEANAKASLAPSSLPHASSPAAPPPVSACFHSVSFGHSLIPGQTFTSETAPAACSPRCGRPTRPGAFPAPSRP